MPQAITHILIPAFLLAIWRDYYLRKKDKQKFPLHYVLIAGIGGVLPDIDIAFFWVLHFFGYALNEIHRQITHTLFVPLIFLMLGIFFYGVKVRELGKHRLRLHVVCLVLAFGTLMHLVLDGLVVGSIKPLYPFSSWSFGVNAIGYLSEPLRGLLIPTVEGIILIIWMIYLELKHKISDFI